MQVNLYFSEVLKQLKLVYPFLICLLLFSLDPVKAQVSIRDSSISMVMISPSIGIQTPAFDMAKRFGPNVVAGISVTYKHKSKWSFSLEGDFIFGNTIKETGIFSGITTENGVVIGSDGYYGDIRIYERGYYITASVGRLFPVKKPNPNCGFLVQAGLGFIQHKIKIDDHKNSVPGLQDDYAKGYDRLTNGLEFRQFVGYVYTGNNRLVNFFGGFEFVEGITQGRRDYNFNQVSQNNPTRFDMLVGIKVGWIIPIFKEAPEKYYIY